MKFITQFYIVADSNTNFVFCFFRFEFEIKLCCFVRGKEHIGVRNMDSEAMTLSAEGE